MAPTSMIHDMVRSGRVSPEDGAHLLELREEIVERRERKHMPRSFTVRLLLVVGVFVLAMLGVRRQNS